MTPQVYTKPSFEGFQHFGSEELLTHTFIKKKSLQHETALFQTKWWDYRFMSPFEATMSFIDTFGIEARKIYARDIDFERAEYIKVSNATTIREGLEKNDDKVKRYFSGFWRGRQVADAIGIPYATYISHAMSERLRAWQRAYLPNPTQIYRDFEVSKVVARWDEMKASRIHFAEHHAYLAQNFRGMPDQVRYHDYLLEEAGKRLMHFDTLLADFVRDDRIPIEVIADRYGHGKVDQIRSSLM